MLRTRNRGLQNISDFLLINFLRYLQVLNLFLLQPSEPISLELTAHILTEYATGLLALFLFIVIVECSKILRIFVYFSMEMLFCALLQATIQPSPPFQVL